MRQKTKLRKNIEIDRRQKQISPAYREKSVKNSSKFAYLRKKSILLIFILIKHTIKYGQR